MYSVSGLEVYKNTHLCFSTQKLYAIYVFNSVQSNSKRFLCTSVHAHARLTTQQWQRWPSAYNTSHADKHVARALISFRYLSSYNRCPQWSVRTCINIFLSYSVHCWKHKLHKAFGFQNISMYYSIPLVRTPCICIHAFININTMGSQCAHSTNALVCYVGLKMTDWWVETCSIMYKKDSADVYN